MSALNPKDPNDSFYIFLFYVLGAILIFLITYKILQLFN